MKKVLCVFVVFLMLLCSCSIAGQSDQLHTESSSNENAFTKTEGGNLVSASGVEYAELAREVALYYLGELEFVGSVEGEEKTSQHLGLSYQTGMFAIKNNKNDDILIRRAPDNEYFLIYRKASLPPLDYSEDNCVRLEFVSGMWELEEDAVHTACEGGFSDKAEIAEFLACIKSQESPREAGLYDLVKQPDGRLENCYMYGVVYGFFGDEPNIAIMMDITSYNDLAYSIRIGADEYVLPEEWLQKLIKAKCTP